jgi:hypothetical protein
MSNFLALFVNSSERDDPPKAIITGCIAGFRSRL